MCKAFFSRDGLFYINADNADEQITDGRDFLLDGYGPVIGRMRHCPGCGQDDINEEDGELFSNQVCYIVDMMFDDLEERGENGTPSQDLCDTITEYIFNENLVPFHIAMMSNPRSNRLDTLANGEDIPKIEWIRRVFNYDCNRRFSGLVKGYRILLDARVLQSLEDGHNFYLNRQPFVTLLKSLMLRKIGVFLLEHRDCWNNMLPGRD